MNEATLGQLLLDNFWNNAPMLEAFNKWGGVLMALIGAVLTVPDAVRHHIQPLVATTRQSINAVKKFFAPPKAVTVQPRSIDANFSGMGNLTATIHPSWPDSGTHDEQHTWIRGELRRIEQRFDDHIQNNEKVLRAVRKELKSLEERVFQTIADLQRQVDAKEAAAVKIDSIGLLPILSGIVLTGVPEELSNWGAWGWAFFAAGCVLTANAIYRSKKSGVWSAKLS